MKWSLVDVHFIFLKHKTTKLNRFFFKFLFVLSVTILNEDREYPENGKTKKLYINLCIDIFFANDNSSCWCRLFLDANDVIPYRSEMKQTGFHLRIKIWPNP